MDANAIQNVRCPNDAFDRPFEVRRKLGQKGTHIATEA